MKACFSSFGFWQLYQRCGPPPLYKKVKFESEMLVLRNKSTVTTKYETQEPDVIELHQSNNSPNAVEMVSKCKSALLEEWLFIIHGNVLTCHSPLLLTHTHTRHPSFFSR